MLMLEGKKSDSGQLLPLLSYPSARSSALALFIHLCFPCNAVMLLTPASLSIVNILRTPQSLGFQQQNTDFLVTPVKKNNILVFINISMEFEISYSYFVTKVVWVFYILVYNSSAWWNGKSENEEKGEDELVKILTLVPENVVFF